MNDFIKEIYSLLEKLQQEITDLEADVSYYERAMRESDLEAERLRVENADLRRELEAENAALKKHCEWLEQNLNLKNTVVDDLRNQLKAALERC